ncbi:hypothetical protein [Sphingomonas sp.]|uniref:DUF6927 domain-containing protein n=1 Tax=Sphingomonas sp. TaxID=28214 RepID=UPI000DAF8F5A|nr:hypothetical protein [Sphingomonas sp.]PZU06526.1 MAG: hypothetical protein DI605_18980 [Sphingomonas sp.]
MGWLFIRDMGAHATARAYLDAQFTYARDDHRLAVLASSMVGSTYYAAAERIEAASGREVFAIVCLTRTSTGARDGCTFGYKDMTEHMGPHESDCPARLLDLLTETQSDYALAWRARCRANLVQNRLRQAKPTPRPGQTIVFEEAMRFSDGRERTRFEVVANPKGRVPLFRDPETRVLCRVPAFRKRGYRLINPAVSPAEATS